MKDILSIHESGSWKFSHYSDLPCATPFSGQLSLVLYFLLFNGPVIQLTGLAILRELF